jgi:hypothetical protein
MGHRPYRPELTAADSYLFPRMKSAGEWLFFCDANDIIKNATEELKRFLQKECFYHLYTRWKICRFVQGDYIERNAPWINVRFFISHK